MGLSSHAHRSLFGHRHRPCRAAGTSTATYSASRKSPSRRRSTFVVLWFDLGGTNSCTCCRSRNATRSARGTSACASRTPQAARAHFRSHGIAIQETTPIPDCDRFFMRDPDGNRIEIIQWLEPYDPGQWTKDRTELSISVSRVTRSRFCSISGNHRGTDHETQSRSRELAYFFSAGLSAAFFSASVSTRTLMSRTAPAVSQVQKPNGLALLALDPRRDLAAFQLDVHRPSRRRSRPRSSCSVTRMRTLYHLSFLNSIDPVVSFSEASDAVDARNAVTIPPQPPTTSEQNESPTGNVVVQKKSRPSTRLPSSATS